MLYFGFLVPAAQFVGKTGFAPVKWLARKIISESNDILCVKWHIRTILLILLLAMKHV